MWMGFYSNLNYNFNVHYNQWISYFVVFAYRFAHICDCVAIIFGRVWVGGSFLFFSMNFTTSANWTAHWIAQWIYFIFGRMSLSQWKRPMKRAIIINSQICLPNSKVANSNRINNRWRNINKVFDWCAIQIKLDRLITLLPIVTLASFTYISIN